jgi:hypothetical protein
MHMRMSEKGEIVVVAKPGVYGGLSESRTLLMLMQDAYA